MSPYSLSEELNRCKNFGDVFQLVKRAVKETLGESRVGLMLYLGNLPINVGAFHQVGSNGIVLNRRVLNLVEGSAKSTLELNSFIFSILLHEYLHSLGYLNERQVRKLVYEISQKTFGEDHPATEMAANGPMKGLPLHEFQFDEDVGDFEIIVDFERPNQNYIS
jgi:hypothetical protein